MKAVSRPSAGKVLSDAGLSSVLITDLTNIRYLSGLMLSGGALLVSAKGYQLFVDSRYSEAAVREVRRGITILAPEKLGGEIRCLRKVGFESENVTVKRLTAWQKKFKSTKFIQISDLISGLRRSKQPDEINAILRASSMTKKVLALIPVWLRPGITEKQLSWKIESACREAGAESMAFESIVAFGEHTSSPHHHPTERRLRSTDIVQIDMGAKADGYCSDYSRVYFMTAPTSEQEKALSALKKAKKSAEYLLRPGITNRALDIAARQSLKADGYDKEFSHSLGHGVGIEIHEGVTLSMKAPLMKLKKNEVITIEPGLYFPGKFGMRIEDTIVVR